MFFAFLWIGMLTCKEFRCEKSEDFLKNNSQNLPTDAQRFWKEANSGNHHTYGTKATTWKGAPVTMKASITRQKKIRSLPNSQIENLSKLNSTDVVEKLYACAQGPKLLVTITERCDQSIASAMEELKEAPFTAKLDLIIKVAEALKIVHQQGVVHGSFTVNSVQFNKKNGGEVRLKGFQQSGKVGTEIEGEAQINWPPEFFKIKAYGKKAPALSLEQDAWAFMLFCVEILSPELQDESGKKLKTYESNGFDTRDLEQMRLEFEAVLKNYPQAYFKTIEKWMKISPAERPSVAQMFEDLFVLRINLSRNYN